MYYAKYSLYANVYRGTTLYTERLIQADTKAELKKNAQDYMRTRPEFFNYHIEENIGYIADC